MNKSGLQKRLKVFRIVFLILTLAWMGVIFSLSAQPSTESAKTSGGITMWIQKIFFPEWEELELSEFEQSLSSLSYLIRKFAHFSGFLILAVFMVGFFSTLPMPTVWAILLSFIGTVIYALSDEIHQAFVPGRGPALFDVLIDSIGAFFGIFFALGFQGVYYLTKNKKI